VDLSNLFHGKAVTGDRLGWQSTLPKLVMETDWSPGYTVVISRLESTTLINDG
jgi:hypothetical protein